MTIFMICGSSKIDKKPIFLSVIFMFVVIYIISINLNFGAYAEQKGIFQGISLTGMLETQLGVQNLHDPGITEESANCNLGMDWNSYNRDSALNYGFQLKLNANTLQAKNNYRSLYQENLIFVKGKKWKLVLGNGKGIASLMQINASSIARASGGISSDATYWIQQMLVPDFSLYIPQIVFTPNLWSNQVGYGLQRARTSKFTYFLSVPNNNGILHLGLSYIPNHNTRNKEKTGSFISAFDPRRAFNQVLDHEYNRKYKNIVQLGLSYATQISGTSLKFGFTGEYGQPERPYDKSSEQKLSALIGHEVGFNLSYMGFSIGSSYGDLHNSGLIAKKLDLSHTNNYWTLGASYVISHFGISVTYIKSYNNVFEESKPNKITFSNLVLGVDYKINKGLLTYLEISLPQIKSDKKFFLNDKPILGVLCGIKIKF
ncbi:hypothetical protein MIDIC_330020 [Alphaproteobacteria bacterium]